MHPHIPRRKLSQSHFSASGVALADILANSVAVLLIMILLMVNLKQQQAETQLEQTVDVSVMMARELANSVVLDALPNSRPAYLHDYTSCAIPHDCNPNLYPIIEIYDNHIRIFNPPIALSRNQLLQENNLLDLYMRNLTNHQLNNIRVDIYGIGMFYLAIATLREYGAPLNHWHFLGENAIPKRPGTDNNLANEALAKLLKKGEEGIANNDGEEGDQGLESLGQQLPSGTDLADLSQLESLESDSLLPYDTLEQPQNTLLDELLGEFSRRREGEDGQAMARNNNQTFRLRIPNFTPPSNARPIELNLDKQTLERVLLNFIFAALQDANNQLRFDAKRLGKIFSSIVQNPNSITPSVEAHLIRDLQHILNNIPTLTDKSIQIDFDQDKRIATNPVTLKVRPNTAIDTLRLHNQDIYPNQLEQLQQGETMVDILLRSYPFVYKGERVAIGPNMLVLSLPENLRQSRLLWRPIAIISPDLQEITLGFIESTYQNGMLELPLEVNQVRANKTVLQTNFAVPQSRSLWQLVFGYGLTMLLLILLLWLCIRWYLGTYQKRS